MAKYLTIDGTKYLIRGPYSATQVYQRYAAFCAKYPDTKLSLVQWATERGAIYLAVKSK